MKLPLICLLVVVTTIGHVHCGFGDFIVNSVGKGMITLILISYS